MSSGQLTLLCQHGMKEPTCSRSLDKTCARLKTSKRREMPRVTSPDRRSSQCWPGTLPWPEAAKVRKPSPKQAERRIVGDRTRPNAHCGGPR